MRVMISTAAVLFMWLAYTAWPFVEVYRLAARCRHATPPRCGIACDVAPNFYPAVIGVRRSVMPASIFWLTVACSRLVRYRLEQRISQKPLHYQQVLATTIRLRRRILKAQSRDCPAS